MKKFVVFNTEDGMQDMGELIKIIGNTMFVKVEKFHWDGLTTTVTERHSLDNLVKALS